MYVLYNLTSSQLSNQSEVIILDEHETTLDSQLSSKGRNQICGSAIDKKSGKGLVKVTGGGFSTLSIPTGLDEIGDRYLDVDIRHGQKLTIHGGAVVLYYRLRQNRARNPNVAAKPLQYMAQTQGLGMPQEVAAPAQTPTTPSP
jgi:hypothetical protein